ncbi:MAG: LLM class flavin-dependent oxidoreductase [Acidimicrobiales bacterium]|jgi:alkanesulfonate monooxygenase SsuD/methylene tetrahydromethanopterin reductase-like flavin-dependent oxidoreductase (luciferase family)
MVSRLGLCLDPPASSSIDGPSSFASVVDMAIAAQSAGFDSLWVTDAAPGPGVEQTFEPYTLLGALSVKAAEPMLGALGTRATVRNPAILAKQVTALDVLSSGRAMLGVGPGCKDSIGDAPGAEVPPEPDPLDLFEEALQVYRGLFSATPFTFDGKYYRTSGATNRPSPISSGGPPVCIGVLDLESEAEISLLSVLAAKYADAWILSGDIVSIRNAMSHLAEECARLDREPSMVRTIRWIDDSDEDMIVKTVEVSLDEGVDAFVIDSSALAQTFPIAELGKTLSDKIGSHARPR